MAGSEKRLAGSQKLLRREACYIRRNGESSTSAHASPVIDVSEKCSHFMKTIRTALALMLSAAYFTGCDSNADSDLEALQAELDDADIDSLVEAQES